MERAPWRGRNRVVSGAAGTHREPLFLGSEPWGQGHTWLEKDLAQLLCCAQGQHPAIQGLCSVLTLTGRTGKEKEFKKKTTTGKWPQAPLPSQLYSQQHTQHKYLPLHLDLPGQVKLPWRLRVSVLGRRSCPVPSPTHPHSHVQGAV